MADARQARQSVRVAVKPFAAGVGHARQSLRVMRGQTDEVLGVMVKVWTGSAYVDAPVKVWTGSAFVDATAVKTWNGSAFV